MESLLARNASGLQVEILWEKDKPLMLKVEEGGKSTEVEIPSDKAMDAFNHPWLYIEKI